MKLEDCKTCKLYSKCDMPTMKHNPNWAMNTKCIDRIPVSEREDNGHEKDNQFLQYPY